MKAKIEKLMMLLAIGLFVSVIYYKATCGEFLLLGYKPFLIMSDSMEPCINTYQFVLAKQVGTDELQVGDIAAYELYSENTDVIKETIIHRVYAKNEDGTYIFKGDNNQNIDINPIQKERIKYKIVIY
ncbi:signal peptidase I [Pseudobutyrivibrio ruminis]|uniref:signal peptidase I n=1 Tax=Pseudobutyrivibrio ruminis TaxID=46206 RepID=UPI0009DD44CA|nr:signal peptidase I [Pseudobutyrivibrio ruminis]